jgi:hypothetical protein
MPTEADPAQSDAQIRCVCRTRNGQLGCEVHRTGVFAPHPPANPTCTVCEPFPGDPCVCGLIHA